jgi:hypothetical protein
MQEEKIERERDWRYLDGESILQDFFQHKTKKAGR